MSTALPNCRGRPRWSAVRLAAALLPALKAGLAVVMASVCVGPPLPPNGPSWGSAVRVPVRLLVVENRAVVSIRFLVPLSVEALAIRSDPLVLLARMLLLSVTLVAWLNNTPPPVLPLKVLLTSENEAEPVSFTAPPLKGTVLPLKVLLVMTVGWKLKTAPPAEDEVLPLKVLLRTVSPATPLVEMAPPSPVAVLSTRAQFTTVSV